MYFLIDFRLKYNFSFYQSFKCDMSDNTSFIISICCFSIGFICFCAAFILLIFNNSVSIVHKLLLYFGALFFQSGIIFVNYSDFILTDQDSAIEKNNNILNGYFTKLQNAANALNNSAKNMKNKELDKYDNNIFLLEKNTIEMEDLHNGPKSKALINDQSPILENFDKAKDLCEKSQTQIEDIENIESLSHEELSNSLFDIIQLFSTMEKRSKEIIDQLYWPYQIIKYGQTKFLLEKTIISNNAALPCLWETINNNTHISYQIPDFNLNIRYVYELNSNYKTQIDVLIYDKITTQSPNFIDNQIFNSLLSVTTSVRNILYHMRINNTVDIIAAENYQIETYYSIVNDQINEFANIYDKNLVSNLNDKGDILDLYTNSIVLSYGKGLIVIDCYGFLPKVINIITIQKIKTEESGIKDVVSFKVYTHLGFSKVVEKDLSTKNGYNLIAKSNFWCVFSYSFVATTQTIYTINKYVNFYILLDGFIYYDNRMGLCVKKIYNPINGNIYNAILIANTYRIIKFNTEDKTKTERIWNKFNNNKIIDIETSPIVDSIILS